VVSSLTVLSCSANARDRLYPLQCTCPTWPMTFSTTGASPRIQEIDRWRMIFCSTLSLLIGTPTGLSRTARSARPWRRGRQRCSSRARERARRSLVLHQTPRRRDGAERCDPERERERERGGMIRVKWGVVCPLVVRGTQANLIVISRHCQLQFRVQVRQCASV
jgi:hypothetical protein